MVYTHMHAKYSNGSLQDLISAGTRDFWGRERFHTRLRCYNPYCSYPKPFRSAPPSEVHDTFDLLDEEMTDDEGLNCEVVEEAECHLLQQEAGILPW